MVSQNLTEDGQRKKWFDPRKETLVKKAYELAELCDSEVALFIQPYSEASIFAFQSRPDFLKVNAVVNESKTRKDFTPSKRLQKLLDEKHKLWASTHGLATEEMNPQTEARFWEEPESVNREGDTAFLLQCASSQGGDKLASPQSIGEVGLTEQVPGPVNEAHLVDVALRAMASATKNTPDSGLIYPTQTPTPSTEPTLGRKRTRPQALDLGTKTRLQSTRRVSTVELSPFSLVSPLTPEPPRRRRAANSRGTRGMSRTKARNRRRAE